MTAQVMAIAGAVAWVCISLGAIAGMIAMGVIEQKITQAIVAARDGVPERRVGAGSRFADESIELMFGAESIDHEVIDQEHS